MTGTNLLEKKIFESGLKKQYIAEKLRITRFGLSKKINNETEFKASEITVLCEVLNITTSKEKDAIFFTN